MDRELDSIYYNIKRNGKCEPVCLSDMTFAERKQFVYSTDKTDKQCLYTCCNHIIDRITELAKFIKDDGNLVDMRLLTDDLCQCLKMIGNDFNVVWEENNG